MPLQDPPPSGGTRSACDGETSIHVARAKQGDEESLNWLVRRFTPLLLEQARYRLGPGMRAHCDPEDLVNEVWAIALQTLPELTARDGRATPVLVKFLATTLLYRANALFRKHATRLAREVRPGRPDESDADLIAALPDDTTGVVTDAVRREMGGAVAKALESLDPADREIILLRAVEQNSNKTVAMLLRIEPNAASMRYQRALEKLRARVPGSVFDDLSSN